jgi:hypothetical protein
MVEHVNQIFSLVMFFPRPIRVHCQFDDIASVPGVACAAASRRVGKCGAGPGKALCTAGIV